MKPIAFTITSLAILAFAACNRPTQAVSDNTDVAAESSPRANKTDKTGTMQMFMASSMDIGMDVSTIETKSFTWTPAQPLKKGDKLAGYGSGEQFWSINKKPIQIGPNTVDYSIMGLVKCTDGHHVVIPGTLKAKLEIKTGETVKSDGYEIRTKRTIKVGEQIPVLNIADDSMVAIEEAPGGDSKGSGQPLLIAIKSGPKSDKRAELIEAWEQVQKRAGK